MQLDKTARLAVVAAAVGLGLPAGGAGADRLTATYGGEITESRHDVTVERRGRRVVYEVVRELSNPGSANDQAELDIDLPTGAVATGLRVRVGKRWHRGELLDASEAADRYDELTGEGGRSDRGPALLSWLKQGQLSLKVFPVPAGGSVKVAYTLQAPLCYTAGHYLADYPRRDAKGKLRAPGARVLSKTKLGTKLDIDFDAACAGDATRSPAQSRDVVVFPSSATRTAEAGYARYVVDDDHALVRLDIEAAPELEPAPRGAAVVFVVDASRSQRPEAIAAQLEVVRGYLRHLPDARFDVVVYRRRAERLLGRLAPARQADRLLDEIPARRLAPGNGSHLERGLAVAAAALADRRGPTRIIAFTDDRLRNAFEIEVATEALAPAPSGTIVHVAHTAFEERRYWIQREDRHRLAGVAKDTGGMAVAVHGGTGGVDAAAEAVLGLVRPIQIDHFTIEGVEPGEGRELLVPDALPEGAGWARLLVAAQAPEEVVVSGWIWGRPWSRRATADSEMSAALPALAFGSAAHTELPETRLPELARAGGAVTSVTSYLARDPDAPPTSVQYLGGMRGFSSLHTHGTRCGGVISGRGIRGVGVAVVDHEQILRRLLADRIDACLLLHDEPIVDVDIDVETTGVEIVDVTVAGATSRPLAACIADAAWELELDERFHRAHATHRVRVSRTEPLYAP